MSEESGRFDRPAKAPQVEGPELEEFVVTTSVAGKPYPLARVSHRIVGEVHLLDCLEFDCEVEAASLDEAIEKLGNLVYQRADEFMAEVDSGVASPETMRGAELLSERFARIYMAKRHQELDSENESRGLLGFLLRPARAMARASASAHN